MEKSDKICNIILSNCSCKIILDNTNMNNSENKNDRRIIDGKIGLTISLREINTKKYIQKINDNICPIQYRNNQIWFLTKYSFIYLFVIEGKYYEFDIRDVKELNLPDPMKDYEVIIRNQRKWLLSFIEKVEANNYFLDFENSMKLL